MGIESFSEIGNKESFTDKTYLNIKPNDSLSNIEIQGFINSELSNAKDFELFDDDEFLLSVFDCCEEDINIEVAFSDSLEDALKMFNPKNWQDITDSEKLGQIKALVNEISDDLGISDIPTLQFYDGKDECGIYNYEDNSISLNRLYFDDPVELVDTIAHELRHAYQHYRSELNETIDDAKYSFNFENYISPIETGSGYLFFNDYYNQFVEVDARAYANVFREALT